MPVSDTFKLRHFICSCREQVSKYRWGKEEPLSCPVCGKEMEETDRTVRFGSAPSVHGDEIDIEVRHGICHEDGTPRRFRSKSELKKAAYEAGYSVHGDTPNPNPRVVEQRHIDAERRRRDR